MTKVSESQSKPILPTSIPALDISLRGQHLIEASAGTGKTWTLTGIVLRLLIEAKRAPEHIIATTFTRAAAAEMRERIRMRLVDFYQLLQWIGRLRADENNRSWLYPKQTQKQSQTNRQQQDKAVSASSTQVLLDESLDTEFADSTIEEKLQQREINLKKSADDLGIQDTLEDPINWYLLIYLLDNEATYPLAEASRRTALVLSTLDKLFVGTLDSLAQKWLREYSAETGYQLGMSISEDEQAQIDSIIHDEVRAFRSRMYYGEPKIYELLQKSNRLTTLDDHQKVVERALQFYSASIDEVAITPLNLAGIGQCIDDVLSSDDGLLASMEDKGYRSDMGVSGNSLLHKNIEEWSGLKRLLSDKGVDSIVHLTEKQKKLLQACQLAQISYEDGGKQFKKTAEKERQLFAKNDTTTALAELGVLCSAVESHLDSLIDGLQRHIALKVRQQLPVQLEDKHETTFSLQMLRLNQALQGFQGDKLAQYIRHHYPVALIDESQDINTEQAAMIEHIYLPKKLRHLHEQEQSLRNGFLLLVGDPKQAIYGFRGGDVATYNAMKRRFQNQPLTLNINRRSHSALIAALNAWFGSENAENINPALAELGDDIYYHTIEAHREQSRLSCLKFNSDLTSIDEKMQPAKPIMLLSVTNEPENEEEYTEEQMVALHIQQRLESGESLEGRPIAPSDIAVLSKAKKELTQLQYELDKLGIDTVKTAEVNIFSTSMCKDIFSVLEAVMYPFKSEVVNRALTSQWYGLSLAQVQSMRQETGEMENYDSEDYQGFLQYFKQASKQWQQFGLLSAIQFLLARSPLIKNHDGPEEIKTVWERLAGLDDGERQLIDLRQLIDILTQHGMAMGEYELLEWLKGNMASPPSTEWAVQQQLPTQSGVQLMTIHKSKGLEFPIVYVLGMNKNIKKGNKGKYQLYLYDDTTEGEWQRRLTVKAGTSEDEQHYANIELNNELGEFKRLCYVAMTRASEQVIVVAKDDKPVKNKKPIKELLEAKYAYQPLKHWLYSDEVYRIPEHMIEHMTQITSLKQSSDVMDNLRHQDSLHEQNEKALIPQDTEQPMDYPDYATVIKQRHFKGWSKTSFTALSRQLEESVQTTAINDPDYDGIEQIIFDHDSAIQLTDKKPYNQHEDNSQALVDSVLSEDDIRFTFVKRANAGSFLHKVFEVIDFNNPQLWSAVIDRQILDFQLPIQYASQSLIHQYFKNEGLSDKHIATASIDTRHEDLKSWINEVLSVPLLASGRALHTLPESSRFAELGFNMGLGEGFNPAAIGHLIKEFLPNEVSKHINLSQQDNKHIFRYLRGEIDLVYEYAGKFYVVDYKSNHLGNSLSKYTKENLETAMNKAGYWLQALIYQVALHRYLKMRIPDYSGNEDKYLGAVEYVFLRGMSNQQPASDASSGRVCWDIPVDLVIALDGLFGLG